MWATRHIVHTPTALALWHGARGALSGLHRALRRRAADWRQERRTRATLRALSVLDDRLLRDIGISRCQLPPFALNAADAARALSGPLRGL